MAIFFYTAKVYKIFLLRNHGINHQVFRDERVFLAVPKRVGVGINSFNFSIIIKDKPIEGNRDRS
jgi:hypothetical protein